MTCFLWITWVISFRPTHRSTQCHWSLSSCSCRCMRSWDSHTLPLHVQQEYQTQSVSLTQAQRAVKSLLQKHSPRQIKSRWLSRDLGAADWARGTKPSSVLRQTPPGRGLHSLPLTVNEGQTVKKMQTHFKKWSTKCNRMDFSSRLKKIYDLFGCVKCPGAACFSASVFRC